MRAAGEFSENLPHVGFFGSKGSGKSALLAAISCRGSADAVTSLPGVLVDLPHAGRACADEVSLMEDDYGSEHVLVESALRTVGAYDAVVLVVDFISGLRRIDRAFLLACEKEEVPCVIAYNKADLFPDRIVFGDVGERSLAVSAVSGENVDSLKALLGLAVSRPRRRAVSNLVERGDFAILVLPVNENGGESLTPLQRMAMEDLVIAHAVFSVCSPSELTGLLGGLREQLKLAVVDRRCFDLVAEIAPAWLPLYRLVAFGDRYTLG